MNDPDLDHFLREWTAPPAAPDSFQREVWHRIEKTQDTVPAWMRWLDALLRPRAALTAGCAALVIGGVAGSAHATVKQRTQVADPTAAYVQSINPFDSVHLTHGAGAP